MGPGPPPLAYYTRPGAVARRPPPMTDTPASTTTATVRARPVTLKFGGAGLATGDGVLAALERIARAPCERPIVVVSAIGEVTDLLDEAAREAGRGRPDSSRVRWRHKRLQAELGLEPGLLRRLSTELEALLGAIALRGSCTPAERDHVLSFGERMSARIVAAALRARGRSAAPVDAWELGLESDSNHGRARPLERTLAALGPALERLPGVPVVTGFVAMDASGRLTTLGRNGSDLSAALVAEAARASELQLWKSVPGVFDADPNLVPDARVLPGLDHDQARALALHGAEVLHPDALAPLARAGIPALVADLMRPELAGTRIALERRAAGVIGLAHRRGLALARFVSRSPAERATREAALHSTAAQLGLEARAFEVAAGGRCAVFADGSAAAALGPRAPEGVELEGGLAALAVVVAGGRELPLADARDALLHAGAPARVWCLDPSSHAAIALVPEHTLQTALRCLHAHLLCPSELTASSRPHA